MLNSECYGKTVVESKDEDNDDVYDLKAEFEYTHTSGDDQYLLNLSCFYIVYDVPLYKILSFFTGCEAIPPLGFPDVTLSFNSEHSYPSASTCAVELTLPTKFQDYDVFAQNLTVAFTKHLGFQKI